MPDYRLYIFDADNTLRVTTVDKPCPNGPGEWELAPGVIERLAEVDWRKCYYGIVSNQAGIAQGFITGEMAMRLLLDLASAAFSQTPHTGMVLLCPHAEDDGCLCRKPSPYMLNQVIRACGVSPRETLMVGDMDTDQRAARNAGCDFAWADEFFGVQEPA